MHTCMYITYTLYFTVCDYLSAPVNGSVISNGTGVDDTARYYCEYGYNLIGDSIVTCQSNGDWSRSPPTCNG